MQKLIVKITDDKTNKDYYLEWSSVIDAPTTYGLELEEFKRHYAAQYGALGIEALPKLLAQVENTGTSSFFQDIQGLLNYNRAGDDREHLDKEGILDNYCRNKPK